jgi:dienelactone hydrolase
VSAAGLLLLAGCAARAVPFPATPAPGSVYHALHRPDGGGPSPAVVLLHTCAGIRAHIAAWAHRLTERGYVALVVDSFTPRGARTVCDTWAVSVDEVAADAFAALAHLRARPDVDPARVGVMGFSYGAMAALRVASASYRRSVLGQAPGFRASVAFYPYCTPLLLPPTIPASVQERTTNLYPDVDTPLLILIGDADDETPARQCAEPAQRLARFGRPVALHVYPGVTHAFDQASLGSEPWRSPRGYVYRYDPRATEDAAGRALAFLDARMPATARR